MNDLVQAVDSLVINADDCCTSDFHLLGGDVDLGDVALLTLPKLNPPALTVSMSDSHAFTADQDQLKKLLPLPAQGSPFIQANLQSLQRLTRGDAKVVYSATLVLNDDQILEYDAGDSIGLVCRNSDTDVNWLLSRVDLGAVGHSADKPFHVQACGAKPVPAWLLPGVPVTARFLLTYCCELHIPVTRRITRLLADCCSAAAAATPSNKANLTNSIRQSVRLLEFSSREGTALFDRYIRDPNVTFLDLLNSFPACRVPLPRLLEILPRLQPRAYTVINRPESDRSRQQSLQIAFTLVDFLRSPNSSNAHPIGLHRYPHRTHGVCTGWLERLWNAREEQVNSVPLLGCYRRKNLNAFTFPTQESQPLIMIGAGTGIAPFLSFLEEERRQRAKNGSAGRKLWLIYGCRSPSTSLLFPDQLAQAVSDGLLSRLCLCFSRYPVQSNQPELHLPSSCSSSSVIATRGCFHPGARYVQHCVFTVDRSSAETVKHEHELAHWVLDQRAKIMVCGEAKAMAPSVREAWISLLDRELACRNDAPADTNGESGGQAYVKRMRDENRYVEDIWT